MPESQHSLTSFTITHQEGTKYGPEDNPHRTTNLQISLLKTSWPQKFGKLLLFISYLAFYFVKVIPTELQKNSAVVERRCVFAVPVGAARLCGYEELKPWLAQLRKIGSFLILFKFRLKQSQMISDYSTDRDSFSMQNGLLFISGLNCVQDAPSQIQNLPTTSGFLMEAGEITLFSFHLLCSCMKFI